MPEIGPKSTCWCGGGGCLLPFSRKWRIRIMKRVAHVSHRLIYILYNVFTRFDRVSRCIILRYLSNPITRRKDAFRETIIRLLLQWPYYSIHNDLNTFVHIKYYYYLFEKYERIDSMHNNCSAAVRIVRKYYMFHYICLDNLVSTNF